MEADGPEFNVANDFTGSRFDDAGSRSCQDRYTIPLEGDGTSVPAGADEHEPGTPSTRLSDKAAAWRTIPSTR